MSDDDLTDNAAIQNSNVIRLRPRSTPLSDQDDDPNVEDPPPPGMIDITTTHLELTRFPTRLSRRPALTQTSLMRAQDPTISWYRYLYNTVGEPWAWHERRTMDDDTLAAIILDDAVAVYVLYVAGVPAGFVELDARDKPDIEIAYFGLTLAYIGRGLGAYLLDWAIRRAALDQPRRLILRTSSLNHPKSIALYQRAGFKPFAMQTHRIKDPRSED